MEAKHAEERAAWERQLAETTSRLMGLVAEKEAEVAAVQKLVRRAEEVAEQQAEELRQLALQHQRELQKLVSKGDVDIQVSSIHTLHSLSNFLVIFDIFFNLWSGESDV